jgi:hypothetical protein
MDSDKLNRQQLRQLKANINPTILFLRRIEDRMDACGFPEIDRMRSYVTRAIEALESLHAFFCQLDSLQAKADVFGGAKSKRDWKRQSREQR